MRWIHISHCCLKISNSLLIVTILLVYSISHPKNMITAVLPTQVIPRTLPIENNMSVELEDLRFAVKQIVDLKSPTDDQHHQVHI